jgi:hypothetical protein
MSYVVSETRELARPASDVLAMAREILIQLGGKRPRKDRDVADQVQAEFNKEVGGRAFPNRVRVIVRVAGDAARCTTSVEVYPVDPIGNRLQFGVVGEPARFVAGVIWERLEARLGPAPP